MYIRNYCVPQYVAAGSFYFYTVCAHHQREKQYNKKHIFNRCVHYVDTALYCIFDYISRITCVTPCVCTCVSLLCQLSLSRRAGSMAWPIINPQSCAHSLRQLCILGKPGPTKGQLLFWTHTAHTTDTTITVCYPFPSMVRKHGDRHMLIN